MKRIISGIFLTMLFAAITVENVNMSYRQKENTREIDAPKHRYVAKWEKEQRQEVGKIHFSEAYKTEQLP